MKWPLDWVPPKDRRVPWYEYPTDIEVGGTVSVSTGTKFAMLRLVTSLSALFQGFISDVFRTCHVN